MVICQGDGPSGRPVTFSRPFEQRIGVARKHDPVASRAAILDAAQRLFLERGFAGTSMSEVAKDSGVTKSLIHHHFGSKEALWAEVKRRCFVDYHRQQMALFGTADPNPELLHEFMAVYFQFLREHPETLRLMSWLQLEGDRDLTDMAQELRDAGIEHIRAAQAAEVLRSDVPAPFILMTFLGLVKAWFADPSVVDDDASAEAYLASAWALFSTGVVRSEPAAD